MVINKNLKPALLIRNDNTHDVIDVDVTQGDKSILDVNPDEIVAMLAFKDVLYVATKSCVYAKDGNGVFHKLKVGENG